MNNENKHPIYSSTDCLSEKILFEYIDNKLTQKERHLIEKHMLDCELCSDALQGLETVKDRRRIGLIKDVINKRFLNSDLSQKTKIIALNFNLVFSVAATVALLIVGVFFFNKMKNTEDAMSDLALLTPEQKPHTSDTFSLLKKEINARLESGSEILKKTENVEAGLTKSDRIDKDIAFAANKKQNNKNSNSNVGNKVSDLEKGIRFFDEKKEANNSESAEQMQDINYLNSGSENQVKKEITIISESTITKNSNAVFDKDSKSDQSKNLEEQAGATSGKIVAFEIHSAPVLSNTNSQQLEQSKKSEKLGAETKSKNRPSHSKENRSNADTNLEGNIAYIQQKVSPDIETLKTETNSTNILIAPLIDSTEKIYSVVDKMPEFPGGSIEMLKFIKNNMNISRTLNQGNSFDITKSFIQFIVRNDGNIQEVKLIKAGNPIIDQEALRIVKLMPKWLPGKLNGKNVAVQYILPIQFDIK